MIFARDLREEAEVAGVAGGLAVHQVSSTIGGERKETPPPPLLVAAGDLG